MKNSSLNDFIKNMSIVYFALLGGQIMFLMVVYAVAGEVVVTKELKAMSDLFLIVVPVFAFGGLAAGSFMYRTMLSKIGKNESLDQKLKKYRTALILKFALHEGPVIFALVCYLLSKNPVFLGIASMLILFFVLIRPTKDKIIQELELKEEGSL